MSGEPHNRGLFVVFEGVDRAGKSSQCRMLAEWLEKECGRRVQLMRFPDRTTSIGCMINTYLSGETDQEDHVIHLLFSANRWELASSMQRAIEAGTTVIVDRYYYSGCVYSAAKQNPTLDFQWARRPDEGLPRPDVCFLLDLAPDAAAKRSGYGEEKYETREMQDRVRKLFNAVVASSDGEDFVKIDAAQAPDEVHAQVRELTASKLEGLRGSLRFVQALGY